jgi:hypothetical protein
MIIDQLSEDDVKDQIGDAKDQIDDSKDQIAHKNPKRLSL